MKFARTVLLTVPLFFAAVAAAQDAPSATAPNANQQVIDESASKANELREILVIEFTAGNSDLPENAQKQLRDAAEKLAVKKEHDVTIAAWADKPFNADDKSLTKQDSELAERRIETLKRYVNSLGRDLDIVEEYNMGKTSGRLAKMFKTEAAQVKGQVPQNTVIESYDDFKVAMDARALREKGGPMKALVIIGQDRQ